MSQQSTEQTTNPSTDDQTTASTSENNVTEQTTTSATDDQTMVSTSENNVSEPSKLPYEIKTWTYEATKKEGFQLAKRNFVLGYRILRPINIHANIKIGNREISVPSELLKEAKELKKALQLKTYQNLNDTTDGKNEKSEEKVENTVKKEEAKENPIFKEFSSFKIIPKINSIKDKVKKNIEIAKKQEEDLCTIDIGVLRNYLRDIFPQTKEENQLFNIERQLFQSQLQLLEIDSGLDKTMLDNGFFSIFIDNLSLSFISSPPKAVLIEETYLHIPVIEARIKDEGERIKKEAETEKVYINNMKQAQEEQKQQKEDLQNKDKQLGEMYDTMNKKKEE